MVVVEGKRIAMLSPIAWRTPPKAYGAWETVVSNITEGLVARGWDVTLFATADSITTAKLFATISKGYEEDSSVDPRVVSRLHISEVFERASEFDLIHNHFDFLPLTYSRLVSTPARAPSDIHPIGWTMALASRARLQQKKRLGRYDQR